MIRSDRNAYIAGHVTPRVKAAIKTAAERSGVSQSEFISIALNKHLTESGDLAAVPPTVSTEQDVPLPLD